MGFLDQIRQAMEAKRAERQGPQVTIGHATGQGAPQPPPGGMMVVAPSTPGDPGVTQLVPPGMPVAPQIPMGRPSYAVIDTGLQRPAPAAEPPGFWERLFAHRAGYLAKPR